MDEKINLCTLFDSNYLDRGVALCNSLNKVESNFSLYIFALNEIAFQVLSSMDMKNVVVIPEQEILVGQLKQIKEKRGRAEYCWTCTPVIIQYVLEKYGVNACTYIDADMYFYESPRVLIEEIRNSGCSVSIIGHRFPTNITKKTNEKFHGKYCVEFNTFYNSLEGRKVLEWWKQRCFESCSMKLYDKSFGDQKYLDEWPNIFSNIYEIRNLGAGVAPWNLTNYRLLCQHDEKIELLYRKRDKCELIFYHFQNLRFLKPEQVDINVFREIGKFDEELIELLYSIYIRKLVQIRTMLQAEYGVEFSLSENRREGHRWRYTGAWDLIAYVAVYINNLLRGKKNKKIIRI